jgi:hypothetical protein
MHGEELLGVGTLLFLNTHAVRRGRKNGGVAFPILFVFPGFLCD